VLRQAKPVIVVPIGWFIVVALSRTVIIVVVPRPTAEHPNRIAPFPSRFRGTMQDLSTFKKLTNLSDHFLNFFFAKGEK